MKWLEAILERFDRLIAATSAASIPGDLRWLSAKSVAAMLDVSPRAVLREYACREDFPKPSRVGHPRWKATEVAEWMESTRNPRQKTGRPRLAA